MSANKKQWTLKRVTDRILDAVGGAMFFVMLAVIGFNVFSFWITGRRYGQLEEIVLTCLVWVSYISLGQHYLENQCIRADFLVTILPERGQRVVNFLVDLASFVIGAFIVWFSIALTLRSIDKYTGVLKISYFWIDLGVVIGFVTLQLNIIAKYLPKRLRPQLPGEGEAGEPV